MLCVVLLRTGTFQASADGYRTFGVIVDGDEHNLRLKDEGFRGTADYRQASDEGRSPLRGNARNPDAGCFE